MFRRVFYISMLVLLIFSFSITAFAQDIIDNKLLQEYELLTDKITEDTDQFLVTITRPEGDESTFKKSYVICGNSDKEQISVMLLIYDKEAEQYIPFKNTDGDYIWDIGVSGIFMKEVILPKEGANDIRIVAYKKSEVDNLELEDNLQINSFTVSLLDRGIKEAIKNGFLRITDMLSQLFK